MTDPQLPPPGWYPEPSGAEGQRWWDGTRWTDYATPLAPPPQPVQPQYGAYAQPQPQPQYGAYVQPQQPQYGAYASPQQPAPYGSASQSVAAGTPTDTVWVWLIIFLPLLGVLPLFFWDWRGYFERSISLDPSMSTIEQALGPYTDPWYLVLSVLGYVLYGVAVWFAYLDRATLARRGFGRTFHWAWAFLSSLVYVIGRSVVVKRQAGRGSAPMWVAIAVSAVMVVLVVAWVFVMMSEVFRMVMESVPTY